MKSLFTLLSLLFVLSITSCSKEKKIERSLHRVGSWEVAELDWTIVTQGVVDSSFMWNALSGSETNAGSFQFDKDGTGNYLITYNEIPKSGNFRWSVSSEGTVTIIETTAFFNNFINFTLSWVNEDYDIIQEAYSFTLDQTGDGIFTGDGGGALQVLNSGSTALGQYAIIFDRIKLIEK
jgi:hypothetical protein